MPIDKGILLAGGSGSRLHPLTVPVGKQLLPVYDKPMIYYSLTILMLAGIRKILVITTPRDASGYEVLLRDGKQWGISIELAKQSEPKGIAEALLIGSEFIGEDPVSLVLGDNILYGSGLGQILRRGAATTVGATVLAYKVKDPQRYGVIQLGSDGDVVSLEEKPHKPKSDYAVPGIYFYDKEVVSIARSLKPSVRGELEITDLNLEYLRKGLLSALPLPRGVAWLDAGTHDSLHQASSFVQSVQARQGLLVASPEEVALRLGLIEMNQFVSLVKEMGKTSYRAYLAEIMHEHDTMASE